MQSTTEKRKEETMKATTMKAKTTHLYRRLTVLGVTAALFATVVPEAFAGRIYSDERLKDEVEPVADALERLRSLHIA